MIRQSKPCLISVDSCLTKARKVPDEVRYNGFGHYPISCSVWKCVVGKVAEIHVRSKNETYMLKYVSRFSMKNDNTMT